MSFNSVNIGLYEIYIIMIFPRSTAYGVLSLKRSVNRMNNQRTSHGTVDKRSLVQQICV